jgi:hypothetical protein
MQRRPRTPPEERARWGRGEETVEERERRLLRERKAEFAKTIKEKARREAEIRQMKTLRQAAQASVAPVVKSEIKDGKNLRQGNDSAENGYLHNPQSSATRAGHQRQKQNSSSRVAINKYFSNPNAAPLPAEETDATEGTIETSNKPTRKAKADGASSSSARNRKQNGQEEVLAMEWGDYYSGAGVKDSTSKSAGRARSADTEGYSVLGALSNLELEDSEEDKLMASLARLDDMLPNAAVKPVATNSRNRDRKGERLNDESGKRRDEFGERVDKDGRSSSVGRPPVPTVSTAARHSGIPTGARVRKAYNTGLVNPTGPGGASEKQLNSNGGSIIDDNRGTPRQQQQRPRKQYDLKRNPYNMEDVGNRRMGQQYSTGSGRKEAEEIEYANLLGESHNKIGQHQQQSHRVVMGKISFTGSRRDSRYALYQMRCKIMQKFTPWLKPSELWSSA